jgi:hypothetical protein
MMEHQHSWSVRPKVNYHEKDAERKVAVKIRQLSEVKGNDSHLHADVEQHLTDDDGDGTGRRKGRGGVQKSVMKMNEKAAKRAKVKP